MSAIDPHPSRPLTERESEVVQSYKRLFRSVDGNVVLKDLMAFGHYNTTTVPAGSPIDLAAMAFAEGERNAVLRILTFLQIKE